MVFGVDGSIQPSTQPSQPQTLKKHCGRPSQQISETELKEIMQKYYFNRNPQEKQQIYQKYGAKKLKDAFNICRLDMGKQGIISRVGCPTHKRQNLSFGWHGYTNGARIKCFVPGCSWTTHFEPMLFHSEEVMNINGLGCNEEE